MARASLLTLAFLVVFLPGSGLRADSGKSAAPEIDLSQVHRAVRDGLRIVQKSARSYPEHRSCFSCHSQTLPILAMVTARDRGFRIDETLLKEQAEFTHGSFKRRTASMERGEDVGGAAMTVAYGLWTLETAGWPDDRTTTTMVSYLLGKQKANGSWRTSSQRPPLEQSSFTCSILAVYYMRKFCAEDQRARVEEAAARARSWFLRTGAETQEDLVSRLGGLALLGAEPEAIGAALEAVLGTQREDGGWGQLPGMASDAYATGLTLFALQRVRVPTTHPAYRRGIAFLLRSQEDDGSWFVKSRSTPIQKIFDNGDPHGLNQFISIPATAWATTALALAIPAGKVARF